MQQNEKTESALLVKMKVFTQTIYCVRKHKFASIIEFVHTATANGVSLEQIKNELQVAWGTCHWFLDGKICF